MRKCKKIWRKRWPVLRRVKTPRLKEPERRREINHNCRLYSIRYFQVPRYRHIFWHRMGIYYK